MAVSVGSAFIEVAANTTKALASLRALVSTSLAVLAPLGKPIELKINTATVASGAKAAAQEVRTSVTSMQAQVDSMFRGLGTDANAAAKTSAQAFISAAASEKTAANDYRQNLKLNMQLQNQAAQAASQAIRNEAQEQVKAASNYRQTIALNLRLKREALSEETRLSNQAAQDYRQTLALNSRIQKETISAQTQANRQAINDVALAYQRVRTAADKAFAGARNWKENRDAALLYQQGMRGVETELEKVSQRAGLTSAELKRLSGIEATLIREQAALEGKTLPFGITGALQGALKAFQGLSPILGNLGPSLGAAAAPLNLLTGGFGSLAGLLNPVTLGIGAVAVAIGAIVVLFKNGVNAAKEFQQQIKGIQSTTEASDSETSALGKNLLAITRLLPVTSDQLTAVARSAVLFGVRGNASITSFTKTIAELGVITRNNNKGFTDLADLSENLTKFLHETGSTAKTFDSDLKSVAATLASVDQNTASTITQTLNLAKFMAAGSVTLGLTRGQIIGLSGALSGLGAEAESGGSSVIRFLSKMEASANGVGKNASKTIQVYERLTGLGAKAFEELVRTNPVIALQKVSDGLRQVHDQGSSVNQVLAALGVTNIRDIKLLDQLTIGNTIQARAYRAQLDAMNGKITLDQKAKIATDNLKDSYTILTSGVHEFLITIGTPALGAVKGFVDVLTRGVHALTDLASSVQTGKATVGGFGSTLKQVGVTAQQAFGIVRSTVSNVFSAIASIWNSVLLPVLTVLAQIWLTIQTAVTSALTIVFNVVVSTFSGVASFLSAVFEPLFGKSIGNVKFSLSDLAAKFSEWAGIARAYIVAVGTIAAALPPVFTAVGQAIGLILKGVIRVLAGWALDTRAYFIAAGQFAGAYAVTLGDVARNIGTIIGGIRDIFAGFVTVAKNTFVNFALPIFKAGISLYAGFVDGVGQFLESAKGAFFDNVVKPVQDGVEFLRPAYNRVVSLVQSAVNVVGKVLAPLGAVLSSLGISLGDALTSATKAATDAIGGLVDQGASAASAAYQKAQADALAKAKTTGTGIAGAINSSLDEAAKGIGNFIDENGGAQLEAGIAKVSTGLSGLKGAGTDLQSRFAAVGQSLGNNLKAGAAQGVQGAADLKAGFNEAGQATVGFQDTVHRTLSQVQTDLKNTTAAAQQFKIAASIPVGAAAAPIRAPIDVSGLGGSTKKAKTPPITAADIAAQDTYKKGLKDLTDAQLQDAKATAIATNNKAHLRAILEEINSRTRAGTAEEKKAAREKIAEAKRAEAQAKRDEAKAKVDAETRAKLVRDIRQSIESFKLLDAQGKVTATSQLNFNHKIEDFQARIAKLPPELQKGTGALILQAQQLSKNAALHVAASQKTAQQVASAKSLTTEITQLNDRFRLQTMEGKVTADSLLAYQQRLETLGNQIAKLPAPLQGVLGSLLAQGKGLATAGQNVVTYRGELANLAKSVKEYSFAELEAARARVVALGGDEKKIALIDAQIKKYKKLTGAQVEQADAQSALSLAGSSVSGLEGERDNKIALAKGNLAEIYRLQLEYGTRIQTAQDIQARAQAAKDIVDVNEKYKKLLSLAGISAAQRTILEADQANEVLSINAGLTNTLAKNDGDRQAAEEQARRNLNDRLRTMDRESRDTIRKDVLDGFQRDMAAIEAQEQSELDADDLTESQKLAIRQKYQPLLLKAKSQEVAASRAIDLQAEDDRYADAIEVARRDGTLATQQANLDAVHREELKRINRGYDDEERDYTLATKRDTGKQLVATQKETSAGLLEEAKGHTSDILGEVDTAEAAQRQSARNTLEFWRTTYVGMGLAGKAALDEVDAALKKLDQAGDKARTEAGKLIVNDQESARQQAATDLGAIGKTEDESDARAKGEGQFSGLKDKYIKDLADITAALKQFADVRDEDLTPDQRQVKDGLLGTQQLYQGFLDQTVLAALQAGDKAADEFTQAQKDKAAEGALSLIEAQKSLADAEGRDGSPAYLAGLQAALAYWRARLTGLKEGTPEYLAALQKITDLETKVTTAGNKTTLATDLKDAAALIGTDTGFGAGIKTTLDGLSAYFGAGGSGGGSRAILTGAAAFVSGLAAVFATGDSEMDKVTNTFVNGVTSVLSKLASGDTIGAIIAGAATVVSTIVDIFSGGANSLKKAKDEISAATKDVKLFDVSKYAKTVSVGGFFGFLGFKKSQIDQESIDIAKTLGDSLYSAISTGMLDGIKAGKASFGELGIDIKKSLSTQILQGLIDGFLKSAVFQATIQPFLDKYIAAMKSGNKQALVEAASDLSGAIDKGNGQLEQFYTDVLVPTGKKLGVFGSDASSADGTSSTGANVTISGSSAQAQYGLTTQTLTLEGASDFATAAPIFLAGSQELRSAVGEWRDYMAASGGRQTQRSNRSSLT